MNLTDIFLKLLNMSFTGAVAIAVVLLVRLLFKKLPKKYTCILWVVVLVRLLCPFTIPTLVIGQPDIPEPIPSNIMEVQNPSIWSEIEVIDNSVNRVLEQNFTPEVGASVNPLQIAMAVGAGIWIAGMVVMLFYTAWNLYRFRKWTGEAVPDKDLGEQVYRCETITPVVTGIVKPKIYLPFSLKEPRLSHVLMHENMHIRRKDHILKVLFYIAIVAHWFNPFVWLAYRLLERDMEMACDEAVIGKLGNEEKKNYCESLLELASSKNHFVGNPVAFGESDVKVRMKNLLNYKKPVFWVSAAVIAVIIIVAISCLSSPKGGEIYETSVIAEESGARYPLTKEVVEPIFAQADLPGMVTEEEYDSEIKTSMDIRDEENRLIMGITSSEDGDKRFLGITLVPYLHSGAATVYLPEEKWEDIITFATLLYGFEDQSMVYGDFIESYEISSIHTEYQQEKELYYKHRYEWIRSYEDATCVIDVCVATDGTKDIQTISFYNSPEYSSTNSEMAAKNFMYNLLTSIPGRYAAYLESGDDFPYLNLVADKATEKCLQSMEEQGYYTLVEEYAEQAGVQIRFVNAEITEVVNGDKDVADYLYTATLTKEKDGKTQEFTVEGEICVVNMLNGWKVDSFQIYDTEALHRHITKESLYPQGYEPSGHETEQLTMDIFLEAVERKQIESVLWDTSRR